MIWILADSYAAARLIAQDQELEGHQTNWLSVDSLYKIFGAERPLVLVQDCYSRPTEVIDMLRSRSATMIRVRCPQCMAADSAPH
jgi:hypothetical protein